MRIVEESDVQNNRRGIGMLHSSFVFFSRKPSSLQCLMQESYFLPIYIYCMFQKYIKGTLKISFSSRFSHSGSILAGLRLHTRAHDTRTHTAKIFINTWYEYDTPHTTAIQIDLRAGVFFLLRVCE